MKRDLIYLILIVAAIAAVKVTAQMTPVSYTHLAEDFLSGRAVAAGADRLCHLRVRRFSVHADAMAHEIRLDLPVAADLGSFLGDHRTPAKPRHAARYRTHGAGMQRYPHTATSMKIRFRLLDQSTYQLYPCLLYTSRCV